MLWRWLSWADSSSLFWPGIELNRRTSILSEIRAGPALGPLDLRVREASGVGPHKPDFDKFSQHGMQLYSWWISQLSKFLCKTFFETLKCHWLTLKFSNCKSCNLTSERFTLAYKRSNTVRLLWGPWQWCLNGSMPTKCISHTIDLLSIHIPVMKRCVGGLVFWGGGVRVGPST